MNLVRETDGKYHVRADLPVADVAIRVDDGALTIAGERKFEKAEQSEKVYRRQSLRSAFSRNLAWQDEGGQMPAVSAPVPILIIDNDVSSASSLELMLHAGGQCETRVACSGDAALAIAAVFEPSVILLEVDLLDVNGYELAQTLRERARPRELRLIALTTSREHQDRELARVAGFERYLLKPVAPLDLSNLLKMPGSPAR
jgi:CheY-like chemotaxis protein